MPCSGKTSYSKLFAKINSGTRIISRDTIREKCFGKDYKMSKTSEKYITELFDEMLDLYLSQLKTNYIILDNTHCKEKYIDSIIKIFGDRCDIIVLFFDVPLYKAIFRNFIRYFKTGKWIPLKVMKTMYKNYNNINKNKYKNLI